MSIWQWADFLPAVSSGSRITLGEGNTPLVRSRRLGPHLGIPNLWFKLESANPTGSYKDRFAAIAVAEAVSQSLAACYATSSGNTGSALAAYCAAAGLRCEIAVLETTPTGKLSQMLAYGAHVFRIERFGIDPQTTADVFRLLSALAGQHGDAPKISAYCHSPTAMSGVQTISYELAEQTAAQGLQVDHVFAPAGGGGLTLAVARGFEELVVRGETPNGPAIHCVQPTGNATIAGPLRDGSDRAAPVTCHTRISGLQVPSVLDGDEVIRACRASGGTGQLTSDNRVWETQRRLARWEGVFCEPAGAVSVAGAWQAAESGDLPSEDTVVCLVTGTGFKDAAALERLNRSNNVPLIAIDELAARVDRG